MPRRKPAPLPTACVMVREEPDLRTMARILLPEIEAWYEDPEHERTFQEWLKEQEAEEEKAQAGCA